MKKSNVIPLHKNKTTDKDDSIDTIDNYSNDSASELIETIKAQSKKLQNDIEEFKKKNDH